MCKDNNNQCLKTVMQFQLPVLFLSEGGVGGGGRQRWSWSDDFFVQLVRQEMLKKETPVTERSKLMYFVCLFCFDYSFGFSFHNLKFVTRLSSYNFPTLKMVCNMYYGYRAGFLSLLADFQIN